MPGLRLHQRLVLLDPDGHAVVSRHPYPPSPERQALNDAQRAVLTRVEELATSGLHGYRARVRLASQVPPPGVPTEDQVRAALATTAPPPDAAELQRLGIEMRRPHLEVVR